MVKNESAVQDPPKHEVTSIAGARPHLLPWTHATPPTTGSLLTSLLPLLSPAQKIDYEGEDEMPRHTRSNIFCPRSFEAVSYASSYAPAEGRTSVFPVGRRMIYYLQQIKACSIAIQLVRVRH